MFEPTKGCPHLQPIELMQKAEALATTKGIEGEAKGQVKVIVTELTPNHMYKCIKTTMTWNGSAWMVSDVDRLLNAGTNEPGEELILNS